MHPHGNHMAQNYASGTLCRQRNLSSPHYFVPFYLWRNCIFLQNFNSWHDVNQSQFCQKCQSQIVLTSLFQPQGRRDFRANIFGLWQAIIMEKISYWKLSITDNHHLWLPFLVSMNSLSQSRQLLLYPANLYRLRFSWVVQYLSKINFGSYLNGWHSI